MTYCLSVNNRSKKAPADHSARGFRITLSIPAQFNRKIWTSPRVCAIMVLLGYQIIHRRAGAVMSTKVEYITGADLRQLAENSIAHKMVKLIRQGEEYAVTTATERPTRQVCQKINRDEYVYKPTGEILPYKHADTKQIENLRRTFANLRSLIRANFSGGSSNQLFITLTYAANVTDAARLMVDFNRFMVRLKRAYPEHNFAYIAVAEPQGRGAWHMHLLLKTNQEELYIPDKTIRELWEQGITQTQRLEADDVGAYYTAYFTDVLAAEEKPGESLSHRRQKGARLSMYPVGMRFYRCSRNIVRPSAEVVPLSAVVEEYGKPKRERAFEIKTENGDHVNTVFKAEFKKEP